MSVIINQTVATKPINKAVAKQQYVDLVSNLLDGVRGPLLDEPEQDLLLLGQVARVQRGNPVQQIINSSVHNWSWNLAYNYQSP